MRKQAPKVFFIAGEASGDALGAGLMASLSEKTGGQASFVGVGGPKMEAAGLKSLFPMRELSVMGLFEVLPKLPNLIRRINQTVDAVKAAKPDVLVTIDAPDFVFRVDKKLKAQGAGVPIVHFVAPSVWAWRPGRAKKVARFLDHLLCLLPFEPPYFEAEGLSATFTGHPVVTSGLDQGDGPAFRARYGIAADAPVLCVLPGSRSGEVTRHLPVFAETVAALREQFSDLVCVLPSVEHLQNDIERATQGWPVRTIVTGANEKADAFAAADAALAASGTVSLELALAGVPMVIAYKMNPLTSFLAKRLVKVRFASLANIILDREAVPEFLLDNCRAELIAPAVAKLIADKATSARQLEDGAAVLQALGKGGPSPSARAAEAVLSVIQQHKTGG